MMTFEHGRIMTWRFPRFSALKMLRRQSFRTDTRTILQREEVAVKAESHHKTLGVTFLTAAPETDDEAEWLPSTELYCTYRS